MPPNPGSTSARAGFKLCIWAALGKSRVFQTCVLQLKTLFLVDLEAKSAPGMFIGQATGHLVFCSVHVDARILHAYVRIPCAHSYSHSTHTHMYTHRHTCAHNRRMHRRTARAHRRMRARARLVHQQSTPQTGGRPPPPTRRRRMML